MNSQPVARPRRHLLVGLTVLVLVSVLAAGAITWLRRSNDTSGPFATSPVPVPTSGAYFGTEFSSSLNRAELISNQERQLGRRFDIDHVYHPFDAVFPTAYDKETMSRGHILFVTWTCRLNGGGAVRWGDISSGRWDQVIDARAQALEALRTPVLVSFCHEPSTFEGADRAGSSADYVAAWRHIAERFRARGATNVAWVWTLTAFTFRKGSAEQWYPGDDVVSWVGVDGYVNVHCPWLDVGWASWSEVFGAANRFATEHRKPLIVAEFSLAEDPLRPDHKRRWLEASLAEMRAMSQLRAVVAFNSVEACSSYLVSSDQALAGYRRLARSNYFNDRLPTSHPLDQGPGTAG